MHYVVAVFRTVTAETILLSYHVTFQTELAPTTHKHKTQKLKAQSLKLTTSKAQNSQTQQLKTQPLRTQSCSYNDVI